MRTPFTRTSPATEATCKDILRALRNGDTDQANDLLHKIPLAPEVQRQLDRLRRGPAAEAPATRKSVLRPFARPDTATPGKSPQE